MYYLLLLQKYTKMAKIHPEMYFDVEDKVTALNFIQENRKIMVGTASGKLQIWSLKSQTRDKELKLYDENEPVLWVGILENSKYLVQARFSETIKVLG